MQWQKKRNRRQKTWKSSHLNLELFEFSHNPIFCWNLSNLIQSNIITPIEYDHKWSEVWKIWILCSRHQTVIFRRFRSTWSTNRVRHNLCTLLQSNLSTKILLKVIKWSRWFKWFIIAEEDEMNQRNADSSISTSM